MLRQSFACVGHHFWCAAALGSGRHRQCLPLPLRPVGCAPLALRRTPRLHLGPARAVTLCAGLSCDGAVMPCTALIPRTPHPASLPNADEEIARERVLRECFTDFLLGEPPGASPTIAIRSRIPLRFAAASSCCAAAGMLVPLCIGLFCSSCCMCCCRRAGCEPLHSLDAPAGLSAPLHHRHGHEACLLAAAILAARSFVGCCLRKVRPACTGSAELVGLSEHVVALLPGLACRGALHGSLPAAARPQHLPSGGHSGGGRCWRQPPGVQPGPAAAPAPAAAA